RTPPLFRNGKRTREKKEVKWGKEEKPKDKPNFGLTGNLAADTNTFHGVVIKYTEPPEARKPKLRWSLYPFKGDQNLPVLYIHRQSAYLIGRDRRVADIPVDHPSCSKQHAALQYRVVPETTVDGRTVRRIKPYLMDLGSANGTFINNKKIDTQRYYELLEKDVIKFGFSTREYVILNEKSVDDGEDNGSEDDVEHVETDNEEEEEGKHGVSPNPLPETANDSNG
ncbi:unnamed protein product, partial [Soboliphyme baturini]|uniref:FHA domain-containing protein n=1 Tax=Soboliphyme baturini TaxID=241478 RepID=A0A183ITJ1_9BILA